MAKAIRLKNEMYLDTSSSIHNGVLLKDYLDDYINKLSNKDFIHYVITTPTTIQSGNYTKIPFNHAWILKNEHESFSFSNGEVTIINPDVKRVFVRVSVLEDRWVKASNYLRVEINGSCRFRSYLVGQSYADICGILDVKQGDKISVVLYSSEQFNISTLYEYSHMQVQVI